MAIGATIGSCYAFYAGIKGTVDCQSSSHSCSPNSNKLLILSIATTIVSPLLTILNIIAVLSFCCRARAFGFKTAYETRLEGQIQIPPRMQNTQEAHEQRPGLRQGLAENEGNRPIHNQAPTPPEVYPRSSGNDGHDIYSVDTDSKMADKDLPPSYEEAVGFYKVVENIQA